MSVRACAVVAAVVASTTVTPAQQATFRAITDLVNFGVTVTDRRGNLVTDLTAADFEIVEDRQPQALRYFARGDEAESPVELHVGLLFDTSGSMGEDISMARTAAIRFLNTLSDAEDMTLVDFDTEVRVTRFGQQDFPRMVERIRSRKPDGWTAMYDALGVYLDGASDDEGRTILVLYTDGGDTRSTIRFSDVLTLLRASDVTVYAIGFLDHQSSSVRSEQRLRLTQIAEEAGGQAFFPRTMKDIDAAYETIVAQIKAQYSLGYVSGNERHDGTWRKVEIKVRPHPELGELRVRTRKGYFAPYRESTN